ncbi:putative LRR receptor-like serine/threonine-protein kinase [Hibiscus syriacus]|uniref:LRR receptor-like serine/threonine-protein kinase n=1 Tax=Hibiscus syriacus TaxID=106335 RepID=A0A6A2ZIE0_HIBSY|nr:putative LRR receptor-like serine/threonine-protein kinase [Hibiscus syriacus]
MKFQRQVLLPRRRQPLVVKAFRRSNFNAFARRVASGEALKDAWRTANDVFEQFVFEARKTPNDRELEIGTRWRAFTVDFRRNWPRYRKQLNDFLETPLGRSFSIIFYLWFVLSGWLFRFLIFAIWILPFDGPLLIGTIANNLVIKGACPACKKQFVGYKSQVIRCTSCGNIVWQPEGDFFHGDSGLSGPRKSEPEIIDVEFEEK